MMTDHSASEMMSDQYAEKSGSREGMLQMNIRRTELSRAYTG
jgi:hypothetical protein